MKKAMTLSFAIFFVLGTLGIVYAASYPAPPDKNDPPGSFRIFYEWDKILINGSPAQFVIFSPVDKRKPGSSEFVEIAGDEEISPEGAEIPPYIFVVTDEMKKSKSVTVEIINLRSDGTTNSNAPYGNFVVNRVGCHVWYKKK